MSEESKAQLAAVYKNLQVPDPNFTKFKCPICKGYGKAQGTLVGPAADRRHIGKCYYCGGSGIAKSPKRS